MGGSDSKTQQQSASQHPQVAELPTDPLINRLRKAFRLQSPENNAKMTHSFLFGGFSHQLINTNASKIDPNNSPFCYYTIKDIDSKSQEILTCILVSPLMGLAPTKGICDDKGYIFHKQLILKCCRNKIWIQRVVKKMVTILNTNLVLLFLEEPTWQLGWSGVTYLQQSQEMNDLRMFRIVNEMEKKSNQSEKERKVSQMFSRVYFKDLGNFKGKTLRNQQGLVFLIRERKTYILGVQNGEECSFFDSNTIKEIRGKVNQYLTLQKERQFLKMIDIEQMQIQTSW